LYTIVYELLNNIVRHSQAKNACLQLIEYDDIFTIIVEDDGIGMNISNINKQRGLGLSGIESKVNYFNGSVAFDKVPTGGLIVTIEIPISNEEIQDNTRG
jgi:signal transduction histidine kinase